jgi:DNA invertase Pin-like site-specific DNA recombinase
VRTRKRSSKFIGDYKACLGNRLCVGLIRGSTVEQLNTLLVQENTIKSYAQAKGFDLLELFIDSGTSAEKVPFFQRDRAQEALAAMKEAGAYHILVTKTDRAFRNHEDCIVTCRVLWDDFGISVHFIDEGLVSSSEKDAMVLQIRASVAEEENRRRRDRQLGAFFVMRASHERCGQYAPYGWRIDPERHRTTRRGTKSDYLAPDPLEQAGLRRLFELMQTTSSTSKTARILNAEGIRPRGAPCYLKGGEVRPSSGKWHPATVQSALEHGLLEDGTHCVVENRGGRLHFDFKSDQQRQSAVIAA